LNRKVKKEDAKMAGFDDAQEDLRLEDIDSKQNENIKSFDRQSDLTDERGENDEQKDVMSFNQQNIFN